MKDIIVAALVGLCVGFLIGSTISRRPQHKPPPFEPSYSDLTTGTVRLTKNQIEDGLKSASPLERSASCYQAGMYIDRSFEKDLVVIMLSDPVPGVCDSAAFGLGRMRSDALAKRYLQGEKFPDYTRSRIAFSLRTTDSPYGIQALRALLKDPNQSVVESALFAIHNSPLGTVNDLRRVSEHPSWAIREAAKRLENQLPARILGKLPH